ncbi:unnamed protein product, partial [Polarella glacialis]
HSPVESPLFADSQQQRRGGIHQAQPRRQEERSLAKARSLPDPSSQGSASQQLAFRLRCLAAWRWAAASEAMERSHAEELNALQLSARQQAADAAREGELKAWERAVARVSDAELALERSSRTAATRSSEEVSALTCELRA